MRALWRPVSKGCINGYILEHLSSGNDRNKTKKSKNLGRVRENISLMGSLW